LTPICRKSFVDRGFAPDPLEGAYSAPPSAPAVFMGPTSKGREDRGEKGRGWEGRVGVRTLPQEEKKEKSVPMTLTPIGTSLRVLFNFFLARLTKATG